MEAKETKYYDLTQANYKKYIGDRMVVFEKQDNTDNLKIIKFGAKVGSSIMPKIYINEKTYDPIYFDFDFALENGWKTFSIELI